MVVQIVMVATIAGEKRQVATWGPDAWVQHAANSFDIVAANNITAQVVVQGGHNSIFTSDNLALNQAGASGPLDVWTDGTFKFDATTHFPTFWLFAQYGLIGNQTINLGGHANGIVDDVHIANTGGFVGPSSANFVLIEGAHVGDVLSFTGFDNFAFPVTTETFGTLSAFQSFLQLQSSDKAFTNTIGTNTFIGGHDIHGHTFLVELAGTSVTATVGIGNSLLVG